MRLTRDNCAKWIGLPVLAAFLFVAYSFLPLSAPARDNSPDENANRFFSRQYAEYGLLWSVEPLNLYAPGLIHPRSTRVDDLFVQPGGFLGLPVLYGSLGKLFGIAVQPFLTALVALLGLAGFGLAVGRVFGARLGWLAALLLAVQPNWWYQASRPFMPNTLFLSLLLLAAVCFWGKPISWLIRRGQERRATARFWGRLGRLGRLVCWGRLSRLGRSGRLSRLGRSSRSCRLAVYLDPLAAGLLVGLALAVRLPAAYWLAIFGLILWGMNGWKQHWPRVAATAVGTLGALLPFLFISRSVYGSWLASGYGANPLSVGLAGLPQGLGARLIGPLQPYLFPLGFAPRTALRHFWDFGLNLYGWWWWLVLAALAWLAVVAWRRARPRPWYRFWRPKPKGNCPCAAVSLAMAGLAVAGWLILFYGSWTVRDNPNPMAVTIGSSYLRYWLPISVLAVLPLAWALNRLADVIRQRYRIGRRLVLGLMLAVLAAAGAWSVYLAPQEGLWQVRGNLYRYEDLARRINGLTRPGDLIVVDRADKYLFPERAVLCPLRSESTYQALPRLVQRLGQVYYLGITFPPKDFNWLNTVKLPPLGLRIEPVAEFGGQTLYRFVSD